MDVEQREGVEAYVLELTVAETDPNAAELAAGNGLSRGRKCSQRCAGQAAILRATGIMAQKLSRRANTHPLIK